MPTPLRRGARPHAPSPIAWETRPPVTKQAHALPIAQQNHRAGGILRHHAHTRSPPPGTHLEAEVNVLVDAKAKVARVGKVARLQLVLLHLQAALQDLLRLVPADGDVRRDLLVAADAKRADRQPRLGKHRRLASELLQHTGGAGEAITRLADAAVEDQLVDLQLPHRVGQVLLTAHHRDRGVEHWSSYVCRKGAASPDSTQGRRWGWRAGVGGLGWLTMAIAESRSSHSARHPCAVHGDDTRNFTSQL